MTVNTLSLIVVRGRLPDTNSSSGILVVVSVPSFEGITPIARIESKRYVHFHVFPSPINESSRQRWQGFSFMDRVTWLLAKALHNQCLPQSFCNPVTPENAKQRYDMLMQYLEGEYDTEIGDVITQMQNLYIRQYANEGLAADFYRCQKDFLYSVVNQLELIEVRPAISVSPDLMSDKMFWDDTRRGFTLSLPPGWKGIHYYEDRQSNTYVDIGEQYVIVSGESSFGADRVSGYFEWQEFIENIVRGYWAPVEFRKDSDASVSIETIDEGNVKKHHLTVRATSLSSALSVACAQLEQFVPGTITAIIFFIPEETTISEEDIRDNLSTPRGIRRKLERLEICNGDDYQYRVVMQVKQTLSQQK